MSHGKTYRFCHGTNINIAISSLDKGHEDRGHLRLAEEGEEDLELAGGEAFLGGAVAGGTEGVEEAWGEVDFTGEEAAGGFLATAIKIGHSQILLELIYCHTFFLLRFYNLFTTLFERRGKNNQKVKIEVWYCPLSYLIRYSFDTDSILFRGKEKQ